MLKIYENHELEKLERWTCPIIDWYIYDFVILSVHLGCVADDDLCSRGYWEGLQWLFDGAVDKVAVILDDLPQVI